MRASRSSASRAPTAFIGRCLFATVVPASALALGSLPTEALVPVAALAALACGLLAVGADTPLSSSMRVVLIAIVLLTGFTALQAVPLPASVCHSIAPANAAIWERALAPFREGGPSWHPLSVTPAATRVEVLRGMFYACTFLGAARIAATDSGPRFLVRLVLFSTVSMAITTLAHAATDAESVFGIYRPREQYAYRTGHLSPLLNTNHLAAYLGIGTCVALGAVFSRRTMPPILTAVAGLVCAGTSMTTISRGAMGALVIGGALVLGLTLYTTLRRRSTTSRDDESPKGSSGTKLSRGLVARISIASIVLAACLAGSAVVVFVSMSDTAGKLLSDDLSKVGTVRQSIALIAASPIFGFGRGAFETVFPSVQESLVYRTWTHPEDLPAQWMVEWGVPVSVAAFAMFAWALRPNAMLRPSRPMTGAWGAIVATLVHEMVDFHLEVPGVTALVLVCTALVVTSTSSRVRSEPSPVPRRASFVAAVGIGIALAGAIPAIGHSLAQDRRSLSAKAVDASVPREAFLAELRDALLRHPAEPFFPLMGAVRAQTMHEGSVMPWISRALERNEHFGRAHLVLARSLVARHPAQARLEYRLAYTYDRDLRAAVVKEALVLVGGFDDAMELVPDGRSGVDVLESLVEELSSRMPSTAYLLDAEIEKRAPDSEHAIKRRVQAQALDALTDAPWCLSTQCIDDAFHAVDELVRERPNDCDAHLLVARLRMKRGDVKNALDDLQDKTPTLGERSMCERRLIELAQEAHDVRRVDFLVDRLIKGGCGQETDCIDLHLWAAGIELQREHWVLAARLYRRVIDIAPDREDILERIGDLGEKPGVRADALDAYRTLAMRHPSDGRWQQRIDALSTRGLPPPSMNLLDAGP